MNKVAIFLFSTGYPSDLYFIDKVIDIINSNKECKLELYVFLNPELEFFTWKEFFTEILNSIGIVKEIKTYNGLNLFFEKSSQNFCLLMNTPEINQSIRFYNLFYPLILESYVRAHQRSDKEIIVMYPGALKDVLNKIHIKKECRIILPARFENIEWKSLREQNDLLLNNLQPIMQNIQNIWKVSRTQILTIEDKKDIQSFLRVLSNDIRQKIFYIIVENKGITARKIQNDLKSSGNSISLPAILKHLSELINANIIYRKNKFYFPEFQKIKITLMP